MRLDGIRGSQSHGSHPLSSDKAGNESMEKVLRVGSQTAGAIHCSISSAFLRECEGPKRVTVAAQGQALYAALSWGVSTCSQPCCGREAGAARCHIVDERGR